MTITDFLQILQKSNTILSPKQTRDLEDIIDEYPYFQAARALHLKGLKNLDSYKYNNALKLTAAHTADRDVLFDYITTQEFVQNNIADAIVGRTAKLEDKKILSEEIEPNPDAEVILGESEESALPQNVQDAEQILNPSLFKSKEKQETGPQQISEKGSDLKTDLELGKPLPFTSQEKHSFKEWLQLTSQETVTKANDPDSKDLKKKKKFDLLDKFIESKPKIVPNEDLRPKVNIKESTKMNKNQLMTETLARVYLEQKKYKKAIQAYKILSLKYPEKNGFFADQIRAVKKLQKEKE